MPLQQQLIQESVLVSALFPNFRDAALAYRWLQTEGYSKNDISLLMSDETAPRFHAIVNDDRVEDKVVTPAGSNATGAIGASIGAGVAATLAAGIGLLAGGPLGAAIAASIPGAMVGGLVGGLVGYGFPEDTAHQYDAAIKEGGVVIGVNLDSPEMQEYVQNHFMSFNGRNVVSIA